MLLNELTKNEKDAFVSLSIYVAKANGVFENEEKGMIEEYCKEMNLESYDLENIKPIEEVFDIYSKSDEKIKKIVFLEILGLVYADGTYDEKENSFLIEFAKKINLPEKDVAVLTEVILKYLDVLREIGIAIN